MVIQIKIADIVINIKLLYEKTSVYFKDYIIPGNHLLPNICIDNTFEDIEKEHSFTNSGSTILDGSNKISFFNLETHEFMAIHRKLADVMPFFNTFLMHGAVVSKDDQAYMFTAPSGTGKTTRAKLWLEEYPGSIIVNGDKPLITITESNAVACGTPWCGKEGWNTNVASPLRAIFILERTDKNEESSIREISMTEAFPFLLYQTYLPANSESLQKTLNLLKEMGNRVKIYVFRSTPTHESIRLAYEATL